MSPPPPVLRAALRFEGAEITVNSGGEIDLPSVPPLASVFVAVAGQSPGRVILDLAEVEFMGVSGLNLIATPASRLRAADGEVVVRSAPTMTRRLLNLIDLGELVEDAPAAQRAADEPSAATSGASVRSLDELRSASTRPRERTIDAALGVVVAWAAAAITNADGISVTLEGRGRLTTAASSDDTAARLDQDQYAVRQGPCVHASTHGEPALVPSNADDARWPEFLPHAFDAGIAAMLSTPLTVASQPVGALNLYCRVGGAFGPAEQAIAGLICTQAAGVLAGERDDLAAAERSGRLRDALRAREVIAQAQGILMHRDAITAEAAAAHLRHESRRVDIPLGRLAAELVAQTGEPTSSEHGD